MFSVRCGSMGSGDEEGELNRGIVVAVIGLAIVAIAVQAFVFEKISAAERETQYIVRESEDEQTLEWLVNLRKQVKDHEERIKALEEKE